MYKKFRRIISIISVPILAMMLVACEEDSSSQSNETPEIDYIENENIEEVNFDDVIIDPVQIDGIIINGVDVSDLQLVQFGADKLDDGSFDAIQKAYSKIYEGAEIDVKQLVEDVGTAAVCVTVYVTLSTVAGPVGTFAGMIVTNELTAVALATGAALDAFATGYQEYQNSHDWGRTIGHALNGVANGAKWGAILAPVEVAGMQGLKLIGNKITASQMANFMGNLDGLNKLPKGTRKAVYENLDDFMDETYSLGKSASKEELSDAAERLSKKLGVEISPSAVKGFLKNREKIVTLASKKGFTTVKDRVVSKTKVEFFKNANISQETSEKIVKNIEKGNVKTLADLTTDSEVSKYIANNFDALKTLFPKNLITKDFAKDCLGERIGREALESLPDMKSSKFIFSDLVKNIGIENSQKLISNNSGLAIIDAAYDSKTATKLFRTSKLYDAMSFGDKNLTSSELDDINNILHDILDGKLKSINDLSQDYNTIKGNLLKSVDIFNSNLKELSESKYSSKFMDDLVVNAISARQNGEIFSSQLMNLDDIKTLLKGKTSKARLLKMEGGQELYDSFVKNPNQALNIIGNYSRPNTTIMKDILSDSLTENGIGDDIIEGIKNGLPVSELNLTSDITDKVGDVISTYYQKTDPIKYDEYISIYSENRGKAFKEYFEKIGKHPRNYQYAGQVAKAPNDYIATKYGKIRYSNSGSPIFDKFAVARVKINDLTGIDSKDIAKANKMYFGNSEGLPGYTWHHLEDGKTLIYIPTELHNAYQHSGGALLIREGVFK